MSNLSVLYVKTGKEEKVMNLVKMLLNEKSYSMYIPYKLQAYRRQGVIKYCQKKFFPGYIFFQFNVAMNEFISDVFPVVQNINDAYRFLSYTSKYDILMKENEKLALQKLLGANFCIDNSIGIIENDVVKIYSGALKGQEEKIRRINRHNREALIEISILGNIQHLTVPLEIISKNILSK